MGTDWIAYEAKQEGIEEGMEKSILKECGFQGRYGSKADDPLWNHAIETKSRMQTNIRRSVDLPRIDYSHHHAMHGGGF